MLCVRSASSIIPIFIRYQEHLNPTSIGVEELLEPPNKVYLCSLLILVNRTWSGSCAPASHVDTWTRYQCFRFRWQIFLILSNIFVQLFPAQLERMTRVRERLNIARRLDKLLLDSRWNHNLKFATIFHHSLKVSIYKLIYSQKTGCRR